MTSKRDRIADARARHRIERAVLAKTQAAEIAAIRAEPNGPEDAYGAGRPRRTAAELRELALAKYQRLLEDRVRYLTKRPHLRRSPRAEQRERLKAWVFNCSLPEDEFPEDLMP